MLAMDKTINKFKLYYLSVNELNHVLLRTKSELYFQGSKLYDCHKILADCYRKINSGISKNKILYYLNLRMDIIDRQSEIIEEMTRTKSMIIRIRKIRKIKKLLILDRYYKQKKLKKKHLVNVPNKVLVNMDKIINATHFAATAHQFQKRKGKDIPYINHPIEVANILHSVGVSDGDILAAAVLHDVLEDTNTTKETIENLFGRTILNIVLMCTDDKTDSKVNRKKKQLERIVSLTQNMTHEGYSAIMIKLADKHSNCSDLVDNPPPNMSEGERKGYIVWSFGMFYYCQDFIPVTFKNKLIELFTKLGNAFNVDLVNLDENQLQEELEKYYQLLA